jgi:hypothetical protein
VAFSAPRALNQSMISYSDLPLSIARGRVKRVSCGKCANSSSRELNPHAANISWRSDSDLGR